MSNIELPDIMIVDDDNESETKPLNNILSPDNKQTKNSTESIKTEDTKKNNVIIINILLIICIMLMAFYIIFGLYEFTNNFRISDFDIIYSKHDSINIESFDNNINNYLNSIKVQYSTIIFTLFFAIIYLQLYKYAEVNHYSMNCGNIVKYFIFLSFFLNNTMATLVYSFSTTPILCNNDINCKIIINLLLCGPIDMQIFSFLVLLLFFGPLTIGSVIISVIICIKGINTMIIGIQGLITRIYGLITRIYDMLVSDRLI
jgi:hypothetical protein